MIKKNLLLVFIAITTFFSLDLVSQNLAITALEKKDQLFLQTIQKNTKHKDTVSINTEIVKISDYLKKQGYFTHVIDSITKTSTTHTVYFSLNEKINNAQINFTDGLFISDKIKTTDNSFTVSIEKLESTLNTISKELDRQGKSFSKVVLKNIKVLDNTLFADLKIEHSEKRTLDKIIIKGYPEFPKSFLKHHIKTTTDKVFSKNNLKEISENSKKLTFVTEIKPPEALFKKDSTMVYLYLKKKTNNSFDALVNFNSNENGKINFNGHVNLNLNNVLNKGEKFNLLWNNVGDERQELNISTEIPFLFNSPITPLVSFSIFRQDSTFTNTKFNTKLFYNLNTSSKLALTFNAENSVNTTTETTNNIRSFNNYFMGFRFSYTIPKNDFFRNNKFHFTIEPALGQRSTDTETNNQLKIEATSAYLYNFTQKHSIFIQNKTGYLNSDSFLENELFRIGGTNSIRGFNVQSIYTQEFTFFNIEYRLQTSEKSYFYTVTDIGLIKNQKEEDKLLGLGLGYLFTSNNSQINLSTVLGKTSGTKFDFKNSQLMIGWINYF